MTQRINSINYIVAIPSYKRAPILIDKTLKTLKEGGVPASKIHIFVANKEEYKEYNELIPKELYSKIIVGKIGIANQRVFIKRFFKEGQMVVSLDDDIEGLFKMTTAKPAGLVKLKAVDTFFKEAFTRLKAEGLYIWGIYPVRNPFFMKNNVSVGLKFIIGALYGFINRHDKSLEPSVDSEGKEDYEQSILYYKKDGGVLRYNNITIKTKFLAEGGLGKIEKRFEMNKKAAEYLHKTYPDICTIFHRKNGMTEIRMSRMERKSASKNNNSKTYKNKTRKTTKYK
jgi:hypothetical protein